MDVSQQQAADMRALSMAQMQQQQGQVSVYVPSNSLKVKSLFFTFDDVIQQDARKEQMEAQRQ